MNVTTLATILFWGGLAAAFYTWVLYPLLLAALARACGSRPRSSALEPTVTVLLCCLNEAAQIAERIENLLALDYPPHRLEVLVASDGSTDRTAEIAEAYADRGVRVVRFPQRRGKASVHNDLMLDVSGEIVVFTDADVRFPTGFLRALLPPFADPCVGGVLAEIEFVNRGDNSLTRSRGLYWRFETALRQWQSDLGLLAIGSGPGMAFRRIVLRRLTKASYDTDFITALDAIQQGFRVVQAPEAVITDLVLPHARGEFRADVRMTAKNFPGTLERWLRMNPLRTPLVSWALISHKFMRWLTPWFLLAMLAGNMALLPTAAWRVVLAAQLAFYALAACGTLLTKEAQSRSWGRLAATASSFCLANAAFCWGTLRGFFGRPIHSYQNLK